MATLKGLIPVNVVWNNLSLTQKLLSVIGDFTIHFSVEQRVEQIHMLMAEGAVAYEWFLNYTNEPTIMIAVLQNAHIGSIGNFYCDRKFDYIGRVAKWKLSVHAEWRECPQKAKSALKTVLGQLLSLEFVADCEVYVCDRTMSPETDRRIANREILMHACRAADEFDYLFCMHDPVLERSDMPNNGLVCQTHHYEYGERWLHPDGCLHPEGRSFVSMGSDEANQLNLGDSNPPKTTELQRRSVVSSGSKYGQINLGDTYTKS